MSNATVFVMSCVNGIMPLMTEAKAACGHAKAA